MARRIVGLLGASGETGSSILKGLTADANFDIVAFARPESLSKPANVALRDKGIQLRALDLEGPKAAMVMALKDIAILISAIGPRDQLAQLPLATAAKTAGVKRFIPCGYSTVMPVGVNQSRDQKEEVYNLVKRLHLPYTIIDVGLWYQISLPELPSGKIDYALGIPVRSIPGDGNTLTALTDLRDVGKYIAHVIKDERTLNQMVFVYNELWTVNQIYDLLEKVSGEKVPRKYSYAKDYEQQIVEADARLEQTPTDFVARAEKLGAQYSLSWGIRGENTPEFARYLGYLDGKKLYPDVDFTSYESYVQEVVSGKAQGVYDELKHLLKKATKGNS
ncbi:uncharacterized protein A1O9_11001 [Exophiala aquamarina CBS 119918]|uniref:NmrA-like domain-containing protein n=1 Tax=Exophiala aquamarina CBS 119918 TaxID=1182545 RepID=A0A072P1E2_9EURO|nr:uncharacterized protein A1O9_11001 [Exophiala aquamarina CBS 119918]KEF53093.1 hypothetical protein A1O9_11001 [Exophiala aquamarina CBS 119918]